MSNLVKNKTRVTIGTIIKIWHGTRGHDYVCVGVDASKKELHLIKHNSINADGAIHASTAKAYFSHKKVSYNNLGIISGVSTVQGHCNRLDMPTLIKHLSNSNISVESLNSTKLYSTASIDRRDNLNY
jgi:hypothetical protein